MQLYIKYLLTFCLFYAIHCIVPETALAQLPEKQAILSVMRTVCDQELRAPHYADNWQRNRLNSWIPSSFYPGLIACYHATGDKKYLNAAVAWSAQNEWKPASRFRHADDLLCTQTYFDLYAILQQPEMLAPAKARLDSIMAADTISGRDDWHWCDALYMAPPAWIRLSAITGDKKYSRFMYRQYQDAVSFLQDKKDTLFFRDKNFFEKKAGNGQPIYWSRGNGWVISGIARMIDYLPAKGTATSTFKSLFRSLAAKITPLQLQDGLWPMSLLAPEDFPQQETSGSAMFCYALLKGINSGWLPEKEYLPAALRAWQALVQTVNTQGILEHVQPGGAAPYAFPPEASQAYAVGAFLLAGNELQILTARKKS
ncbi:hypothetical protein ECE50_025020 [Chitinophaga sp. Mgbs1]|uniref:Glycosyl hydrolase family 88 n=1 Tax=Chitinophaga solisilvae TaxID=1233460 RepID=A0A9Q5D5R1_9BACT|nr:hypothetical protein [Chitinophaga solisilvae]